MADVRHVQSTGGGCCAQCLSVLPAGVAETLIYLGDMRLVALCRPCAREVGEALRVDERPSDGVS